jgi:ATP phosphoribosyltransferase regulatory subunit
VKNQLLPEGFRDSLPDLALEEYRINDCFLKITKQSGFSYVNPPLIEFESSLFFLSKEKQRSECFRVLDPLSQKIMAIRSDITSQIARISCGSLFHSKRPLKLSYSGEVLKVKNNNLSMSRQSRQIGAEVIGINKDIILVDIIKLIVKVLDKLNFKDFILNFSMPNLIEAFVQDFKLSVDQSEKLVNSFKNKNLELIKSFPSEIYEIASFLISAIGDIDTNLPKLENYKFSKKINDEIRMFIKSVLIVKKEFSKIKIFIDPLEVDEIDYHDNISFKVYSKKYKELFNGGFYFVNDEKCIGFSGLIECLRS